jgi:hypothetical protein
VSFQFTKRAPVENAFDATGVAAPSAAALEIAGRGEEDNLIRMRTGNALSTASWSKERVAVLTPDAKP